MSPQKYPCWRKAPIGIRSLPTTIFFRGVLCETSGGGGGHFSFSPGKGFGVEKKYRGGGGGF